MPFAGLSRCCGPRRDLRGIRGCNLGLWREDLVRVNGYNEAFVGWGREDSELVGAADKPGRAAVGRARLGAVLPPVASAGEPGEPAGQR